MLNVLLWLPLAVGLVCLVAGRRVAGPLAVLGSFVTLGLAVALILDFDSGTAGLQRVVDETWIPDLGVRYTLGIDGVSLFLIALTAIAWAGATTFAALRSPDRAPLYFFMLGVGETATLGAFMAQDLLLFVLFFDLMLIPFYFLIGAWGQGERVAATTKMIVYTLIGSLLMLVAAIATAVLAADGGEITFSIAALREDLLPEGSQDWIFWFFAAAFLVKMPAFLVHGWMADAYRAAPLPVLACLSGVLSKVGAYGFIRVVLPIFPDAAVQFQDWIIVIGLASIIYGSVMAFTQVNIRLIAGYSSIAQLGFITIGIFSLQPDAVQGAVLQMVNHGLVVVPIFLIIALLAERAGTEDIREMGGLAMRAPVLAAMFVIVTMATLAMPGSSNFIGEFYILNGLFREESLYAVIGILGVPLAAFYALRMYQRTMHNRVPDGIVSREISLRDGAVVVPLVAVIVALSLWPGLILERGEAAIDDKVEPVAASVAPVPLDVDATEPHPSATCSDAAYRDLCKQFEDLEPQIIPGPIGPPEGPRDRPEEPIFPPGPEPAPAPAPERPALIAAEGTCAPGQTCDPEVVGE